MLELSMFSKSSGEIFGTLLTRSIKNRPTLLSAATLPDWKRLSSAITKIFKKRRTDHFFHFSHLPARPQYMRAPLSACPVSWQRSHPPETGQRSAPWCDLELDVSSVKGPLWTRQIEALRTIPIIQKNTNAQLFHNNWKKILMACLTTSTAKRIKLQCLLVCHYLCGVQPSH